MSDGVRRYLGSRAVAGQVSTPYGSRGGYAAYNPYTGAYSRGGYASGSRGRCLRAGRL